MTVNLFDDPSCECSHNGQSHPYSIHTADACTSNDFYGLPCACTSFQPIKDYPAEEWRPE
ncbi:hypothetical protein [Plantactinospora endophytica]|uniref:Uncharacterized protein n=1 Tax=Plantactinospora endophytica TaxID=673535 RepID=A0ABQ4EC55_9ACTN|nr:hypothetical protein [Plantactinospora endophytica]GIG92321.1 hypothetical protein Pen02_72570 [Plantactinospora endophytica]